MSEKKFLLIDFGIATFTPQTERNDYTAETRPPELFDPRLTPEFNSRLDLFALGVSLILLRTGKFGKIIDFKGIEGIDPKFIYNKENI